MGAFAVQGAAMGAASSAIMGTSIGEGAAWGAGFGAATGFVSSQQVANWRENGSFMSNSEYAAQQSKINSMLDPLGDNIGEFGLASTDGHTGMVLTDYQNNQVDFFGKYPATGAKESAWFFGKTGAGKINNEFGMPQLTNPFNKPTYGGWAINQNQYNAISSFRQNPGTFALTTNCAEFALRGARYIGINAPSNLTKFGFTDPHKVSGWLNSVSSYGAGL
jgi:hypothetical protein